MSWREEGKSIANRNYSNGKSIYIPHVKPVLIDCNFIVDSTNGNGLGIRSLKGSYVQNVFMHTTQTAGTGNSNNATPNIPVKNPNPPAGYIIVQLQDPYFFALSGFQATTSPLSGSSISISGSSVMTVGQPYVITSLGTSTTANWQAVGVPTGVIPTVGMTFMASVTGGGTGTGTVQAVADAGSGIFTYENVGDTEQMIGNSPLNGSGFGGQIILACRKDSAGDAPTIAAPANGTVISLAFYINDSSVKT